MFQFPNWSIELPGCRFRGRDAFWWRRTLGYLRAVDDYLRRGGAGLPEVQSSTSPRVNPPAVGEIDFRASNIRSVVWATGYDLDFRWIELPVFDARGEPAQNRGVTSAPGIYFLGLAWMHKVKSSILYGVGEDASYIAERICGPSRRDQ